MNLLAAVLDTNVVLAANLSSSASSPNRELLVRWINEEFTFLYSTDTRLEYIEKLLGLGIARSEVVKFIRSMELLGRHVTICQKGHLLSAFICAICG